MTPRPLTRCLVACPGGADGSIPTKVDLLLLDDAAPLVQEGYWFLQDPDDEAALEAWITEMTRSLLPPSSLSAYEDADGHQ